MVMVKKFGNYLLNDDMILTHATKKKCESRFVLRSTDIKILDSSALRI